MRIKELRIENDKTQTEIANILGISRQVFANYEKEINFPDPKMLIKLADYFDVSIDYLVGREDDFGVSVRQNSVPALTVTESDLLRNFLWLNLLTFCFLSGIFNSNKGFYVRQKA